MEHITVTKEKIKEELALCLKLYQEAAAPNVPDGIHDNVRQGSMVDRFWLILRLCDLEHPYAFPCALNPDKEPERFEIYCEDILKL